tara:strand:- start:2073 stop:2714 length:642 start_codon:yes stop_codon:yes gene_type:complete
MNEDIEFVNQSTRIEKFKNFITRYRKNLIFTFLSVIVFLFVLFIYQEFQEKKKLDIAEKFNNLTLVKIKKGEKDKLEKLIEIIASQNETYSILSLNYIIDNQLIDDKSRINNLFDDTIKIQSDNEIKNLIIYKKGLFNSDDINENELLKILNPILKSQSIWKPHSLLLMSDYFYANGNPNKSKQFLREIVNSEKINNKVKIEAQKRLRRYFNE